MGVASLPDTTRAPLHSRIYLLALPSRSPGLYLRSACKLFSSVTRWTPRRRASAPALPSCEGCCAPAARPTGLAIMSWHISCTLRSTEETLSASYLKSAARPRASMYSGKMSVVHGSWLGLEGFGQGWLPHPKPNPNPNLCAVPQLGHPLIELREDEGVDHALLRERPAWLGLGLG